MVIMAGRWLIIDGYSLLHRHPQLAHLLGSNLSLARQRLLREMEELAGTIAERLTLVFDGRQAGGPDNEFGSQLVEVHFSPSNMTADTVIERFVTESDNPDAITVITSDRDERVTVSAAGAHTMSCTDFLEDCAARRKSSAKRRIRQKPPEGPTLADFFPED
ncbi:MAG: NYN domain-containing protein [Verrucomicrobia bacterium]|nr:NYN domain-containing protein [Verrucomicrobiota bacterium]